jgi:hypothetical protein
VCASLAPRRNEKSKAANDNVIRRQHTSALAETDLNRLNTVSNGGERDFSTLTQQDRVATVTAMSRFLLSVLLFAGGVWTWAVEQVPEFKLTDVSLSSNRRGMQVSPRDYLLQVSGYYFGDSG